MKIWTRRRPPWRLIALGMRQPHRQHRKPDAASIHLFSLTSSELFGVPRHVPMNMVDRCGEQLSSELSYIGSLPAPLPQEHASASLLKVGSRMMEISYMAPIL